MKYFLDCGTHFFEGFNEFDKKYNFDNTWKVYSFEANPITYNKSITYIPDKFKKFNYEHLNIAISDIDDEIMVNCEKSEDFTGVGSNILEHPPEKDIVYGPNSKFTWQKEKVKCINFPMFINNIKDLKYLVVKMDIEGAEFQVIKSLIDTGAYLRINEIYVEFHERFFIEEIKEYENLKNIYCEFFKKNGIEIKTWF